MAITRSRSVLVADVSERGAKLGGRDLPSPGDDVLIIVGSTDRMAIVRWRNADECGLELDEALAPDTIELMEREADWSAMAGWEQ